MTRVQQLFGSAALIAWPHPSRLHRTIFKQGLFERCSQVHMSSDAVLMLRSCG